MADLIPVQGNPFEAPQTQSAGGVSLTPVNFDPFGQGAAPATPDLQSQQQQHDAVAKNALTPPNLGESAIPPPLGQQAPQQPQQPDVGQVQSTPFASSEGFSMQEQPQRAPDQQDPGPQTSLANVTGGAETRMASMPAGSYINESGIVHNENVPKVLDTAMAASQYAGKWVRDIGSSLANKEDLKKIPGAAGVGYGQGSGELASGLGQAELTAADFMKHPTDSILLFHYLAAAREARSQFDEARANDYLGRAAMVQSRIEKAAGGGAAADVEKAGQLTKRLGQEAQEFYGEKARQAGLEQMSSFGPHATIEKVAYDTFRQLPLAATTEGTGAMAGRLALPVLRSANPGLMEAAAGGNPMAKAVVERVGALASNAAGMGANTVIMAGMAGAEAQQRIEQTPVSELMQNNGDFRDLVASGADPEKARQDLARRAGDKASMLAAALNMAAMKVGSKAFQTQTAQRLYESAPGLVSGMHAGVQNGIAQGAIQFATNAAMNQAGVNVSPMQGVATEFSTGYLAGHVLGMMGHRMPRVQDVANEQPRPSPEVTQQPVAPSAEPAPAAPQPIDAGSLQASALVRWSRLDGGRTTAELKAAQRELDATGQLPEHISERLAGQFNPDGTLTHQALQDDLAAHPGAQVFHVDHPEAVEDIRHAGVNPYVLPDGSVSVLGQPKVLEALRAHVAERYPDAVTGISDGQAWLDAHPVPEDEPAEAESAEAPEPEAAPSARAEPVTQALQDEGIKAPVDQAGRVTVEPGHAQGEDAIRIAANDAAHGENERKPPTPAQMKNGNYPKGKLLFPSEKGDLKVNIESPAGSIRRSLPGEPKWARKLTEHYGYIPGTYSKDGEPVDAIVGRQAHDDTRPVFVFHQTNKDGSFDEHKVVLGARTEREARDMYLKQYPQAMHEQLLQGTPQVVRMTRGQFGKWVAGGDHDVPIHPLSKQPMLNKRVDEGQVKATFKDTDQALLAEHAQRLSEKFKVNLKATPDGIEGEIPKAKLPALDRSLKRIEGHEATRFDGNEPGQVLRPSRRGGDEGVSEGRELRGSAEPAGGQGRASVPPRRQRKGQEEAPAPRWLRRPVTEAPAYAGGKGKTPVSVVGVHYRPESGLNELATEGAKPADHRLLFQVREGRELPRGPEGHHAYETRLDNLYDVRTDPDGIIDRAAAQNRLHDKTAILHAIHKAGYDGVLTHGEEPLAMLVGERKVPTKQVSEAPRPRIEEPRGATITERAHTRVGIDASGKLVDRAAYQRSTEDYGKLPDTMGGKLLSADSARELSADYLKDRSKSGDVHEASSSFIKQRYADLLKSPHEEGDYVLFTAGGTGAGKTTALQKSLSDTQKNAEIIYDTNLNNYESSLKKINQAIDAGREVRIAFVYRDPVEALRNGALARAERQRQKFGTGRTAPLSTHAATHADVLPTLRRLVEHFQGDDRVSFKYIDNSLGKDKSKLVTLDRFDNVSYNHDELMAKLREELEDQYKQGKISEETYHGFRQVQSDDAARAGGVREGEQAGREQASPEGREAQAVGPGPGRQPEPERQEQRPDIVRHAADLAAHAERIVAGWKGAPGIEVHASAADVPDAVKPFMDSLPKGLAIDGFLWNGKVHLLAEGIDSPAHAERVIVHETMGHYGLRGTFGKQLDGLLNDIHASIKDGGEYKALTKLYGKQYGHLAGKALDRAITEEFLSNRAELQAKPSVLAKVVAWVRQWARERGMVRTWSDSDILNLMDGVARNVREGRVSTHGYDAPQAVFDDEAGTLRTSYHGAAGEGSVLTLPDGERELALDGLAARLSRAEVDGRPALRVDNLAGDLGRVVRFAAEEGKAFVVRGEQVLPVTPLDRAEPRFSIRAQRQRPQDLQDRIDRVLAKPESDLTLWDRLQQWGRVLTRAEERSDVTRKLVQGFVDQFKSIADLEMRSTGSTLLDASESAYKFAWMSQNTRQVMGAVMKLGVPKYDNGSFVPVAGRKGLLDIFLPLYQHKEPGLDRDWEFYAMARRAEQLIRQVNPDGTSKEKLMTPDDIAAGLALEQAYPMFKQVFDDWQEFNRHVLDLAVERGNMTKEMADLWKQNDYVPFYRVADDNEQGGGMPGGLGIWSKKLTGSDRRVEPIIDNIVGNTASVLRRIYANEALRRTAAIGDGIGIEKIPMKFKPVSMSNEQIESALERQGLFVGQQATKTSRAKLQLTQAQRDMWTTFFRAHAPEGPNIFKVMEGGKPVYYKVDDPTLMQAIGHVTHQQALEKWFRVVFGTSKNLLTHAITLNPAFMLRHLERQAVHTWIQSGEKFNPFGKALESAKDVYTNSEFMQRMQMAGEGGNEYYDINHVRDAMWQLGKHTTVVDKSRKLWHAYRKIGHVADQMNRMSVAKAVLERGGSVSEAAWQAQDLLNFSMHGDYQLMRYLTGMVPFLNARVQGMYRIVRGAQGLDQSYRARSDAFRSFLIKSGLLIAASQALQVMNNGNPKYERLPDEAKDLYWHIFVGDHHFAIAKPFELGAVFSTLPDRAARYMEGYDGTKTFNQSLARVFGTVFRFDIAIAATNPIDQDRANRDDLTQMPIVPEALQNVDPSLQYNSYTSPTIKAIAQSMPDAAPNALRSPMRLEHLTRGYIANMGGYLLAAADSIASAIGKQPPRPSGRLPGGQITQDLIGSTYTNAETDPRNRYVNMIYEDKKRLDEIKKSVKEFQQQNDVEKLNAYYQKNKAFWQYRKDIMQAYSMIGEARKAEIAIYQSPTMTPDQKRAKLDEIARERNQILDRVAPLLNLADSL